MLGIACAWRREPRLRVGVGVDLERVRPTAVAGSCYAFSQRERRLLRDACRNPQLAGLCGWVAKEAAWKALRLPSNAGPDAVELRAFDATSSTATVVTRRGARAEAADRDSVLRVKVRPLSGPDGDYLVGVAVDSTKREVLDLDVQGRYIA
jgi:hypothetical protein